MLSVIFLSLSYCCLLSGLPLISEIYAKDSQDPIVKFSLDLEQERLEGTSIVPFLTLMNWCLLHQGNRTLILSAVGHSICELVRDFDPSSSVECRGDLYADFIETSAEFSLFSTENLLKSASENSFFERSGNSICKRLNDAFSTVMNVKDWASFYYAVWNVLREMDADLDELKGFELGCKIAKESYPEDYLAMVRAKEMNTAKFFWASFIKRIFCFFKSFFLRNANLE
jgi:hypothetical protein